MTVNSSPWGEEEKGMIIIDGTKSEKNLAAFTNLEEVLNDLMQDEKMENRIVTDVLVNNELFSEIYPHQAEDIECSGINSVEVRSVPVSEMAMDIAAEMDKVAQMMGHGARQVSHLFREAADTDALELFQDLLDVTRDFMGMLGDLRQFCTKGSTPDFTEKTEKFSNLLSEMGDVLENEDWILLADLLEYEFTPLCDEWRMVSGHLHEMVVKHLAQ
jgi:hypothetical protein